MNPKTGWRDEKILVSLCILILALSLCSCGGTKAEAVTPANFLATLDAAIGESPEEAERLYLGKTVQVNFLIDWIMPDGVIVMSGDAHNSVSAEYTRLTARLSEEELAMVEKGDVITLEGTISGFSEYVPSKWSSFANRTQVEISPAKIIGRTYQVSGKILDVRHLDPDFVKYVYGDKPDFFILESDEVFPKGQITVYLEPEIDYEAGQTVTATGTLLGGARKGAGFYGSNPDRVTLFMDEPESIVIEGS